MRFGAVEGVDSSLCPSTHRTPRARVSQVWLEFSICDTALRSDRAIGDKSALCSDAKPIGRVTFTLFRDTAPGTCRLFEQLISDGVYVGARSSVADSCVTFMQRGLRSPSDHWPDAMRR